LEKEKKDKYSKYHKSAGRIHTNSASESIKSGIEIKHVKLTAANKDTYIKRLNGIETPLKKRRRKQEKSAVLVEKLSEDLKQSPVKVEQSPDDAEQSPEKVEQSPEITRKSEAKTEKIDN
ncbi:hypothetical protein RFI_26623, partial [Reticulomyxa filosa]